MILLEPNLFEYNYFVSNRIGRCRLETPVHRTYACPITSLDKGGDTHGPATLLADGRERINMQRKGQTFRKETKGTKSHSIDKKNRSVRVRDKKAPTKSLFLKF